MIVSLPAEAGRVGMKNGRAADAAAVLNLVVSQMHKVQAAGLFRCHYPALPRRDAIAIIATQDKWRNAMEIKPSGSVPTRRQPKESFTGVVWQDPIIEAPAPARIRAGRVSFEPGARTAWHTHPLGQTLHVISGVGRVQAKGGPIREIKAGDTVWIPPGEQHWHGAGPATGMVHIAMQESLDGKHVAWMEHVTDEEYSQALGGS
jgi:quercetin dioxygenase-like cupin family protein